MSVASVVSVVRDPFKPLGRVKSHPAEKQNGFWLHSLHCLHLGAHPAGAAS